MNKKAQIILILFLVCILPGSLVFAGGSKEKADEAETETIQETVTILHFMGEQTKRDGLKALCDAVTAKHPEITFEIEGIAYSQYAGILKTRIAADDAPDLFTGWPNQYRELIEAEQVMPLSEFGFVDHITEDLRKECTINNNVYGVPLDIQMYGVFYNKDLFQKYDVSIPKTHDEFIQICDLFMSKDIIPLVHSFKDGNAPWVEYSTFAFPMLAQDPSTKHVLFKSVVDKKAKLADYPVLIQTFEIYAEFLKYTGPGDFGIDQSQGIANLAIGERPMFLNGGWITGDLYAANPEGNFGFFPTPWSDNASQNKAVSGLDDVFMASATSTNKKGIQYFFEMVMSEEGANIWMESTKLMKCQKGSCCT